MRTCANCAWRSDGIQDPKGMNWCHSAMRYVKPDSPEYCQDWADIKIRINPETGEQWEKNDGN